MMYGIGPVPLGSLVGALLFGIAICAIAPTYMEDVEDIPMVEDVALGCVFAGGMLGAVAGWIVESFLRSRRLRSCAPQSDG